jgi:endonuclease YncB( thermonuclease family)
MMNDASHNKETSPGRQWLLMRERMRDLIHDEVDKLHPNDDARRALELIIESSVRPSEVNGELKLTVIDRDGQPRTISQDGRTVEFTLQDLLEELRASHPVLFTTAPSPETSTKVATETKREIHRDWLTLGESGPSPDQQGPKPLEVKQVGGSARFHRQRGKIRLHGWSHNIAQVWKASAPTRAKGFKVVRDSLSASAERARGLIEQVQDKPLHRRPGFALGIVAAIALLIVGVFLLLRKEPASQASIDEPSETGAVSSAQTSTGSSSGARPLRGVPDVIDTATLSLEGEVVRLFGVEWAPGAGKPEDLARYLQGREVSCEPAGGNDTYRCRVGEQDLSRVILFNGGGQPTAEATPELKAAAEKAREAKIGVWSSKASE